MTKAVRSISLNRLRVTSHRHTNGTRTDSSGLGGDFLNEFRAEMRLLAQRPQAFQAVHRNFHHLPLKRFPFVIIYKFDDTVINVYRVFHTSMDPSGWKS